MELSSYTHVSNQFSFVHQIGEKPPETNKQFIHIETETTDSLDLVDGIRKLFFAVRETLLLHRSNDWLGKRLSVLFLNYSLTDQVCSN